MPPHRAQELRAFWRRALRPIDHHSSAAPPNSKVTSEVGRVEGTRDPTRCGRRHVLFVPKCVRALLGLDHFLLLTNAGGRSASGIFKICFSEEPAKPNFCIRSSPRAETRGNKSRHFGWSWVPANLAKQPKRKHRRAHRHPQNTSIENAVRPQNGGAVKSQRNTKAGTVNVSDGLCRCTPPGTHRNAKPHASLCLLCKSASSTSTYACRPPHSNLAHMPPPNNAGRPPRRRGNTHNKCQTKSLRPFCQVQPKRHARARIFAMPSHTPL